MSRFSIIVGHFGSGKTEVAINMAMNKQGRTAIVDLDIVNPYFRTADAEKVLVEKGIKVILPRFANTNVDIPALPSEIMSVFADKEINTIFDVGGDDDGATALGRYFKYFSEEPYEMYFVINTSRPLTKEKEDIIDMMRYIESASRLKITYLVNNTHMSKNTTPEIVLNGQKIVSKVSEITGIPIGFTSVKKDLYESLKNEINNPLLGLDLNIKLPFGEF